MTQGYLPGTEPKHHDPDIQRTLDAWLEARVAQKRAANETRQQHAALLLQMAHAGVEIYPYTDASGKKRKVEVTREPKAKVKGEGGGPRFGKSFRRGKDAKIGDDAKEKKSDSKVESRRVPRSTVKEASDPFASTRAAMKKPVKIPKKKKH